MLVKYVGSRRSVNMTCGGRKVLYFGPENSFTQDIQDEKLVAEVIASPLHMFRVVVPTHTEATPKSSAHVEIKPAPAKDIEMSTIREPKKKKEKK